MKLLCTHDYTDKKCASDYVVDSKKPNLSILHAERPETFELIGIYKTIDGKLMTVYHDCTKGKLSVFCKA